MRKTIKFLLYFIAVVVVVFFAKLWYNTPEQKRNEKNIKLLKPGMTYGQVVRIMGVPKDIL